LSKKFENKEQDEGVGARVRRSIGTREIRNFDPFLMLDEFHVTSPAGFPDHPHRGFETVTYMLDGQVQHEDFAGHGGIIGPGDLQWMTAGRGIVHSEMPVGDITCTGLQLWINLPKEFKMVEPAYQELKHENIPKKTENGVTVTIIAGESMGIKSPIYTRTPTMYLDFKLEPNSEYTQEVPADWNAFIFVLDGEGHFGDKAKENKSQTHYTLILSKGDRIRFANKAKSLLHFVLIAGKPINEPVVQHGPFVMNTREEIEQTFVDYHSFRNGFEKARNWRSRGIERSLASDW